MMKAVGNALLIPCVIAVLGTGVRADTTAGEHVVILLDASGSMAERMGSAVKIDAAKDAVEKVLATVPQSTRVGLLVFTADSEHQGWVHPLGPRDDEALKRALRPVTPNGGTPLGEYIKRAADRLLEVRKENLGYGSYRLLVVTDGEASDAELMARYTPEVMARGIRVDAIGVDMRGDHALATQVHSYRRADDASVLQSALAEVLGEVSSSSADGASAEEAFELISGLPDGVASPLLLALAHPSDQPIGEDPAFIPAEAGHIASGAQGTASGSASTRARWGRFSFVQFIWLIIVIWIVLKVVRRFAAD